MKLVFWHQCVLEELDLEVVDFGAAAKLSQHIVTGLTGQGEVDRLDLQAFYLGSNVVEVLVLGDADVIL